MNADTLSSLQILQSEIHPQAHNQGPTNDNPGSKEGLSVYGLFQRLARTPQGKALLRQYFLRPSLNIDVINERLDSITVFLRPENDEYLKSITNSLGKIKNMKTVLIHLRKGISNAKGGNFRCGLWSSLQSVGRKKWIFWNFQAELILFSKFAFHSLQIREVISKVCGAEKLSIWAKVIKSPIYMIHIT